MKYFVMSDIHIDFFVDLWKNNKEWGPKGDTKVYENVVPCYEKFYEMFMESDSENLIVAGDIANDYYNQVNFINFISRKYNNVYITFGNHDLGVKGATFGNGNPFKTSEERMSTVMMEFKDNPHVHIMESPEMVNNICGCMGMCDFHILPNQWVTTPSLIYKWRKEWYDGRVWRYMTSPNGYMMNPIGIWCKYKDMMMECVKKHPKIMITHFAPIEMGVCRYFESADSTAFFYFEGKQFLDEMEDGSYWICGHVHNAFKTDYVNSKGNTIHILSMPNAYPGENPYTYNNLTREDRIIKI